MHHRRKVPRRRLQGSHKILAKLPVSDVTSPLASSNKSLLVQALTLVLVRLYLALRPMTFSLILELRVKNV